MLMGRDPSCAFSFGIACQWKETRPSAKVEGAALLNGN